MVQNGAPLGQMVIELGLETSAFSNSLTGATRAVKTSVKEMQASFRVADAGGQKIAGLTAKQNGLTKVIQAQKNELGYLKKAYDNSLDAQGNATSKTARAAQKYNEASSKLAQYEAELRKTNAQMARFKVENEGVTGWLKQTSDRWVESGQRISKFGQDVSSVGSALTKGLTLPLLGMSTVAIKSAIDFESAFAGVKKTVDEQVDANGRVIISYDDLSNGIRNMAKELPASAAEIANVAETAGQLGIKTQDVLSFTRIMIDMGESTNLSANDAATAIAKIANITGMTSDEYAKFGSAVVALGNNFATTESDLVQMTNRLASAGKLAGLTNPQILGLATAMSSVGIEAEAGGTAMTQTLTAMEKAVSEGGDSLKQFAEVSGVSSQEFVDHWNKDPIQAIQEFIKGLGKLDKQGESATQVLDDMGLSGIRQSNMLKSLALASDTLTGAVDMSTKAWGENTALTDEANKRYETTESKLKMLKNEVVDVGIEMGGPLVDALRDAVEAAKPTIQFAGDLAKKFSDLDESTQQNIIKWGALALAAGPVISLMGKGITVFGNTKTALGSLGNSVVELAAKAAEKKALNEFGEAAVTMGTSAATASGATGIGAMTSALGVLAPALLGIVGVGGALALGYGAWKLFGEEAWNSSQRIDRWGTDVGSTVDEVLSTVKEKTEEASGQFDLLSQGITSNSDVMVNSFEKMGTSIETALTNKIATLKGMLDTLPEDVRAAGEEITNDEIKKQEEYLGIVKENTQKIQAIRQNASNHNRELSYNDMIRIKSLAEESSTAYVESLGKSKEETKQILSAMTGDVETASKDQAQAWLQSLGKQRQDSKIEYKKRQDDLKKELVDAGYDLNSEYSKQMLDLLQTSSDSATQLTEDQMALILGKYPELAEEVFLANGQLISSMGDAGQSAVAQNKKMMESMEDFSNAAAKNMLENKDKAKLTLDEANQFEEWWNGLVLDPINGEVKTNAQEAVNEAASSEAGWNQLMWIGKDATVSSNVKMMIAEAAIANGKWDSMTYTEQQALLDSNVTKVMTQALQANGDWDGLTFEEQKALIYSNTPEVMAETMVNLGLWDEYHAEIKDLDADNYELMNTIAGSEQLLNDYNNIDPDFKDLLAKSPADLTFNQASDFLEYYNDLPEDLKTLLGNNSDIKNKIDVAKSKIDYYNRQSAKVQPINASTNAAYVARVAQGYINSVHGKTVYITTYRDEIRRYINRGRVNGAYATYAKGTNFHPGGLAVVNDQKGSNYKELIVPKKSNPFIMEGRNQLINLERGAKVLRADLTKKMFPHYADGVGIPENSQMVKNLKAINANDSFWPKQNNSRSSDEPVSITINLNGTVVREEADIKKIYKGISDEVIKAMNRPKF